MTCQPRGLILARRLDFIHETAAARKGAEDEPPPHARPAERPTARAGTAGTHPAPAPRPGSPGHILPLPHDPDRRDTPRLWPHGPGGGFLPWPRTVKPQTRNLKTKQRLHTQSLYVCTVNTVNTSLDDALSGHAISYCRRCCYLLKSLLSILTSV